MANPPALRGERLSAPEWQAWLDRFPEYSLLDDDRFSDWRREVEKAALAPFPQSPLSAADRMQILAVITRQASPLKASTAVVSQTTYWLSGATGVTGVAGMFFHPLLPIAVGLAAATAASRVMDAGLGSNAGNKAVHTLLTETAGRLP